LQRKKKKKNVLALNFRLAAPINLRFKKAQQLTVSNAFPAQDFIRICDSFPLVSPYATYRNLYTAVPKFFGVFWVLILP
jgi:hypothetical protein